MAIFEIIQTKKQPEKIAAAFDKWLHDSHLKVVHDEPASAPEGSAQPGRPLELHLANLIGPVPVEAV